MIVTKTQNNFGKGQINPRLQSRVKEEIYEHGVLEAINCLLEPSGILKKKYGQQFIADLTTFGTVFELIEFAYSVQQNYLLVFYPSKLRIYQNSTFITQLDTVFDAESIPLLRNDQSTNTMVICDGIHKPQQLILTVPLFTWAISDITFINVPTYDFAKNYYSITFTPSGAYGTVTITAGSAIFTADLVGGIFIGNGGIARITAYTDTTHITVETLGTTYFFTGEGNPTGTVKPINGVNAIIKEPVWSTTRGWPTNPCLHNNRLWFGGTTLRQQGVWGSVIGDYYNFDEGPGLPDYAISVNIDSKQLNSIVSLLSANNLQILTNKGVYVLTVAKDGSVDLALQCREGSADVAPVFIDSQTIYAQRGGKVIRNFLYNFQINSYDNTNISIYASDIIINPVDSAVLKYSDNESTNYLFFVNSDGTIATFQSQRSENIAGWTVLTTGNDATVNDQYLRCEAVGDSLYFIVKRLIGGVEKYYLEEIDPTVYLDCYITFTSVTPTTTVTGLSALNGRTVQVIRDGYIENTKVVAGGQLTSDLPGNDFIVGLKIESTITPLPLAGDFTIGPTTYVTKTVRNLFIDMYETFGVEVNNILIPYFYLDNYKLNSIVTGVTGIARIPYLKNWELRQNIQITHDYPTPFTLCGIGYEVVLSLPG